MIYNISIQLKFLHGSSFSCIFLFLVVLAFSFLSLLTRNIDRRRFLVRKNKCEKGNPEIFLTKFTQTPSSVGLFFLYKDFKDRKF